jgi:hypothetical protein
LVSLLDTQRRFSWVSWTAGCGTARPVVWEDGGSNPASYPIVPSMFDSLEVKVLFPILMEEKG